jgi:predicted glycosyltransferase
MGHLVRSLALAGELAARFRVILLNGGRFPEGISAPEGVEVVDLPPVGLDAAGRLVSRDRRRTLERAQAARQRIILETVREVRPRVVFVELFPFGRKKFAGELLPLLEAARGRDRALVVCSLRDILVGRDDQQRHDDRAVDLANRYFDAVLVHSDPRFARLEESLRARAPLTVPVYYTGFVVPGGKAGTRPDPAGAPASRRRQVVVSAGGGLVGERLLRAAADAHAVLWPESRLHMKLVAGPFLPEAARRELQDLARGREGLSVRRTVRDLSAEMRASQASVSQCGYNTALDILRAGTPALVVPFGDGGEDEQRRRAERLARLGAVRVLEAGGVTPGRLAEEIRALATFRPRPLGFDLDGAAHAARLLEGFVEGRAARAAEWAAAGRGM